MLWGHKLGVGMQASPGLGWQGKGRIPIDGCRLVFPSVRVDGAMGSIALGTKKVCWKSNRL